MRYSSRERLNITVIISKTYFNISNQTVMAPNKTKDVIGVEDLVKVVQALRVLQVLGHPAMDAIQLVFRNISVHIWDKFWDNFSASDISRSLKHDLGFGGMFWNKKVSIELPP